MQLNFTPEQEAKLASIADRAGKPIEEFLTDAALNMLSANDHFLEAVERGIAAADRGDHRGKRDGRLRREDAEILMRIRWTAPAAADLEQIKACLDEHDPHLSHRTVRIIMRAFASLRKCLIVGDWACAAEHES